MLDTGHTCGEEMATDRSEDWTVYEPYQDPTNPNAPVEMVPVDPYAAPAEMVPVDPGTGTQDPVQAPIAGQNPVQEPLPVTEAPAVHPAGEATVVQPPSNPQDGYVMTQLDEVDPSILTPVAGDPWEKQQNWHKQETDFTCGVVAQEFIAERILGVELQEADLKEWAFQQGILTTEGTTAENVDNILNAYGIATENTYGNDINTLANSLAQGKQVIAFVDGQELIHAGQDGQFDEGYGPNPTGPNHFVEVIGIVNDQQGSQWVVLNDPLIDDGKGAMVPVGEFLGAWEDNGNHMVAALPPVN